MSIIKKTFDLLNPNEKRKFIILIIFIFFVTFLDVLGVASILPFLTILGNPQLAQNNKFFIYFYEQSRHFGVESIYEFILFFGIVVFLFLMICIIFRAITVFMLMRFALMREYSLSRSLVENYLHQPYIWFLNRNSSELGAKILSEVYTVVEGILIPIGTLISKFFTVTGLLILLILVDPMLAISTGTVLGICYVTVFLFVKNLISKIGQIRLDSNTQRFTVVREAFAAWKEIKIGLLEVLYIDRFSKFAHTYAINQSLAKVIASFPRYFLETIAFGGIIILTLILHQRNISFTETVSVIAVYVFAGYRLIPAIEQIYSSIISIRFSKPALDILYDDFKNLRPVNKLKNETSKLLINKAIVLNSVYFRHPNKKEETLKNINIKIPAFSKIGIVGTTGGGKTTIIDILLGLLEPSKGSLVVDGISINNKNKRSWQLNIGYVPQQIYLANASISANIAFGVDNKKVDKILVEKSAKIANLHKFVISELPKGYNTIIGEQGIRLSGGQRQRIGIARALYHNPKVLILDEATSSLDSLTEKIIVKKLNSLKNKITLIQIAHRLSTVKNCDIIFLVESGRIKAQGSYEELIKNNKQFKSMVLKN